MIYISCCLRNNLQPNETINSVNLKKYLMYHLHTNDHIQMRNEGQDLTLR